MTIIKNEIYQSFNAKAKEYEEAALVQKEIGIRMLQRLAYIKINPQYILDLGCGTSYFSVELQKLYPKAQILGLDLVMNMLLEAKKKPSLSGQLIQGDAFCLPFANNVFDLVFSNQLLHWTNPIKKILKEIMRVLKNEGCLLFSTLGPDTFIELQESWSPIHPYKHTNEFADMHDIGDALLGEFFVDPVMDMEKISIHYDNLNELLCSLKKQGVKNINKNRPRGLTGKSIWENFKQNFSTYAYADKWPLTYEVIYGFAWKKDVPHTSGDEFFFPLSNLKKKN